MLSKLYPKKADPVKKILRVCLTEWQYEEIKKIAEPESGISPFFRRFVVDTIQEKST